MKRKPPAHVYSDSVTLQVCTGVDRFQNPTYRTINLNNVCLQASNETRRTTQNTEVILRSILFYDGIYSSPKLDLEALKTESEGNGYQMRITAGSYDYTVESVDTLNDEYGRFDHAEMGLV